MELVNTVKERLGDARKHRGLTQTAAAKLLPFSRAKIAAQESPNNEQNPDVVDLQLYAEAYGVSPVYFISGNHELPEAMEALELLSSIPVDSRSAALDILRAIAKAHR